jgi:hypothetical protein
MSAGTILDRTHAQALARLRVESKQGRAELKEQLRAGQIHLADLLSETPAFAEGMWLIEVLTALPRIWRRKAQRALLAADAEERTRLGNLSERQCRLLLAHFQLHHPAIWALWNVMARRAHEGGS